MDDMRQHISLSRRRNGIVKPRLCNMAAERYRQSTRPRGSDESRGRCCLCGNLCAADFRKLSAEAFGRSFSRASQPMRSVGASAGLHSRCVRPELQPGFAADAFGQSFSRASQPMRSVGFSAELHGRCVRSGSQPIFQATMESPYLIIS